MDEDRTGQIAVIFVSHRTGADTVENAAYATAAVRMEALATVRSGYRGMDSVRAPDGTGITVSYWTDEAAARAWRDDPEHAAVREAGRERWYDSYTLTVAAVTRSHAWRRA